MEVQGESGVVDRMRWTVRVIAQIKWKVRVIAKMRWKHLLTSSSASASFLRKSGGTLDAGLMKVTILIGTMLMTMLSVSIIMLIRTMLMLILIRMVNGKTTLEARSWPLPFQF